jgi:hypothetical protein
MYWPLKPHLSTQPRISTIVFNFFQNQNSNFWLLFLHTRLNSVTCIARKRRAQHLA